MRIRFPVTPFSLLLFCILANVVLILFFYIDQNTGRIEQMGRMTTTLIRENVKQYDKISLKVGLNAIRAAYPEVEYLCLLLPDETIVYAGTALSEQRLANIKTCQTPNALSGIREFDSPNDNLRYALRIKVNHNLSQLPAILLNPFLLVSNFLFILIYLVGSKYLIRYTNETRNEALVNLSRQVAHDIRSPLSALNMVASHLTEVAEEKRLLIRAAAQRITDIANNLLQEGSYVPPPSGANQTKKEYQLSEVFVSALIESVASEKRAQFIDRGAIVIRVDLSGGYGLFVRARPDELARVISNLLNNAVEACGNSGLIELRVCGNQETVWIEISDNGRGIPRAILDRLGQKGLSYGKANSTSGSGLGLYHARRTIEALNGGLKIESTEGDGTTILMTLPRAASPSWFLEELVLERPRRLVTVDDDPTIHQVWANILTRYDLKGSGLVHKHFLTIPDFEAWLGHDPGQIGIFLVDFEFRGETTDGLDLIERNGIAGQAILVTSRHDDPNVQQRATRMGIRIIPKSLVSVLPIFYRG